MLTDYKIDRKEEKTDATVVAVTFYKGKITTEKELVSNKSGDVLEDVTRYRRLGVLRSKVFKLPAKISDEEIEIMLNEELLKDNLRDPIPEQSNV